MGFKLEHGRSSSGWTKIPGPSCEEQQGISLQPTDDSSEMNDLAASDDPATQAIRTNFRASYDAWQDSSK